MWKNPNHVFGQPNISFKATLSPQRHLILPLLGFPLLPKTSPDLRRRPRCPEWQGASVVGSVLVSLTPQHSLESSAAPAPSRVMRIFVAAVSPSPTVSPPWKCSLLSHVRLFASHGLWSIKLLCPWDFPGKATGVGSHFLLQGIPLSQGSNPSLWHWQVDCLPSEPPVKPSSIDTPNSFSLEHSASPGQGQGLTLPWDLGTCLYSQTCFSKTFCSFLQMQSSLWESDSSKTKARKSCRWVWLLPR